MKKSKSVYLLVAFILSFTAAFFSCASFFTQQWVVANGHFISQPSIESVSIRYGLFFGTYDAMYPNPMVEDLAITCNFKKNICAFVCALGLQDSEAKLLRNLVQGRPIDSRYCSRISRIPVVNKNGLSASPTFDKRFINAGAWLSTVFFLALSIVFGLIGSVLCFWNSTKNDTVYFNIFGLYTLNIIAIVFLLVSILSYGIMFAVTLVHNVAISHVIDGTIVTNERAYLGFSYWFNLAALFLYSMALTVLYLLHFFLDQEKIQEKNRVHFTNPAQIPFISR